MPAPKGGSRTGVPENLKILKGSLNSTREKEAQAKRGRRPQRVPGIPDAPPYLSKLEREGWDRFADVLGERGMRVVTKQEFAGFEALVIAYAKFQRLSAVMRHLADDDIVGVKTTFDKQGHATGEEHRVHPIFAAVNAAESALINLLGRFGLTPGDAGRVGEAGTEGDVGVDPVRAAEGEFT